MSRKPTTAKELAIASDLRKRGLFFDEEEFRRMETDCRGLSILQNTDLPSTARHLRSGETGYAFNAVICNHSDSKMLSPCFCDIDGPEWESHLVLLPDPGREALYCFDPREDVYDRKSVLNHFI